MYDFVRKYCLTITARFRLIQDNCQSALCQSDASRCFCSYHALEKLQCEETKIVSKLRMCTARLFITIGTVHACAVLGARFEQQCVVDFNV